MKFKWKIGETSIEEHFDESQGKKHKDDTKPEFDELPDYNDNKDDSDDIPEESPAEDPEKDEDDELPLPSECLFGLHSIALAEEIVRNHGYIRDEKPIAYDFYLMLNIIDDIKRVLISMEQSLDRDDDELSESVYNYIDTCRKVYYKKVSRSDVIIPDVIEQNEKVNAIAKKILVHVQDPQKEKQPYNLYESIMCSVSGMEERRVLVRSMKPAHSYFMQYEVTTDDVDPNYRGYYRRGEGDADALSCQMVLKKDIYARYVQVAKNVLNRVCNSIGTRYASIRSYDDYRAFKGDIDNLKDDISKLANGFDFRSRFSGYQGDDKDHNKCYGLLRCDSDRYVSLSGNWDAQDASVQSWLGLSAKLINNSPKIIAIVNNVIQNDPLLYGSLYSEVNKDTVSYIPTRELIKNMIGKIPYNYIDSTGKTSHRVVSCCERKMISKSTTSSKRKSYLFTRHKPCGECQQAIAEFRAAYGILRVFYFNEDKDHPTDDEIHEYC